MHTPLRQAFGDFVLDREQQRVLRRDGSVLALTPRLFSALVVLVDHAGELLDKDTLMAALWPGLVVDDNSLSQVISGLRRALGDDAQGSRYIQTVPRRGFRFIARVTLAEGSVPGEETPPPVASRPAADPVPLSPPTGTTRQRRRLWLRGGVAAGFAAAGGAIGLWAWQQQRPPGSDTPAPASTLAVLPFKPLAAEARDELLEMGMADSLIAQLSLVPGLVVRSVGSVRRYAGADQDPVRAAHELNVTWIVDGSLQRRGDQLRVTARLLRAADGSAAWSGSFDERHTGVFELQDRISARVARVLAPSLGALPAPRTLPGGLGGTRNTDAYQLYLAAARLAQDMRAEGLRKSLVLYNQALELDPGYALAWVGLAEAHRRTLFGADAVPAEVFEPAGLAVRRALDVVPNLAEARAEQAFRLYWFHFDWPGAESEFRAALALNPNVVMARFGLASLLLNQDRPDEGLQQLRAARELDPMSPVLNALEASYLLAAGRNGEARTRLARALDIAPGFWLAHCTHGLLDLAEGRPRPAIERLRHATGLAEGNSRPVAVLAMYLARLGQRDEARAILNQLLALSRQRYVPPSSLAAVHAELGETGPALDALDRAFETRDTRLTFLKDDPRLAVLRAEPRFVALMRKLKLDGFGAGLAPV